MPKLRFWSEINIWCKQGYITFNHYYKQKRCWKHFAASSILVIVPQSFGDQFNWRYVAMMAKAAADAPLDLLYRCRGQQRSSLPADRHPSRHLSHFLPDTYISCFTTNMQCLLHYIYAKGNIWGFSNWWAIPPCRHSTLGADFLKILSPLGIIRCGKE